MICLVPAWCLATKQDTQGLKTLDTKGFFYYGYYSMVEDGRTISIENKTVSTKHLYDGECKIFCVNRKKEVPTVE